MKTLAQATLDYVLFLLVTNEKHLDPRLAENTLLSLVEELQVAAPKEREALSKAAQHTLELLSKDPEEDDYTAQLVTDEERDILSKIADGTFFASVANLDKEDSESES